MIDQTQMNRVALANQLPLNKVAKAFLPDDWGTSTEVAVLTLMRWGAGQRGRTPPGGPVL